MNKDPKDMSSEERQELYLALLGPGHSKSFMDYEIKDMFSDPDWKFGQLPRKDWKTFTLQFLEERGYTKPITKIFN